MVPNDYEALKRYNLAEIFEPTPKEQPQSKNSEAAKHQPEAETKVEAKETKEAPVAGEQSGTQVKDEAMAEAPATEDETAQV